MIFIRLAAHQFLPFDCKTIAARRMKIMLPQWSALTYYENSCRSYEMHVYSGARMFELENIPDSLKRHEDI